MRAIDTNVLVRFPTDESHRQTVITRRVIAEVDVFVSTNVVLETD